MRPSRDGDMEGVLQIHDSTHGDSWLGRSRQSPALSHACHVSLMGLQHASR